MKRRGFTIPELLLVVLIIGLLTSAGTGLYVGTFRGMQVRKAALDFLLTARYARILALERQSRCTMVVDMANQGFSLTMLQLDQTSQEMTLQTIRDMYCRPVQFEGDVQFEAVEVVPGVWEAQTEAEQQKTIAFSPNGTAEEAVVQIGNGRTHYTISIDAATSRAKMYFGTAENAEVTTVDLDAEQ